MQIDLSLFSGECSCGRNHQIDVREIIIESGALKRLKVMFDEGILSEYKQPVIVCDENTWKAAKDSLTEILSLCTVICLDSRGLHANNEGVAVTESRLSGDEDLILAVGSGTIHDLSRYVAFHHGIPFVSVPTAASVDGFVSTVAAMTWDGMKKTMEAEAPILVLADTEVFSKAPYRLTASGISDLLGKYTAIADWKISHVVTGEYLCGKVCELEMEAVDKIYHCIDELKAGKKEAYEELMYALLLSGLAMQMIGNSRPASGAEHHMSHLWEMEVINDFIDAYHGEKVSVGLLLVAERYEKIKCAILKGTCHVKKEREDEEELLKRTFGKKGLLKGVREENKEELLDEIDTDHLAEVLPEIAGILGSLPDYDTLKSVMERGGCKSTMEEIHLSDELKELSMQLSPYVRRRLTFMRISKLLEYSIR